MILPATAESTGGICMACKQGIRNDITAARVFHAKMKAYDPYRELWKSLVDRSSKDVRLAGWSSPEKAYFSVCLLEGEIYNGGFDQYLLTAQEITRRLPHAKTRRRQEGRKGARAFYDEAASAT